LGVRPPQGVLAAQVPAGGIAPVPASYELQLGIKMQAFPFYMYFLDKGALIIGFADKRPLIQRALL